MPIFKAKLTDDDRMPFGKHKGECLGDVPTEYLSWLYAQDWITQHPALSNYLDDLDLPDYDEDSRSRY